MRIDMTPRVRFHLASLGWMLCCIFILSQGLNGQPSQFRITVQAIGVEGNEPLADTEILILETGLKIKTDRLGRASFQVPALGRYNLRLVGGQSIDRRIIQVQYSGQNFVLFSQSESPSIHVRGQRRESNLSSFRLSNQEIKRLPGTQGDSLKAIQTLPGILPATPVGLSPTPQFNIDITGQPYRNSDRGDFALRGAGPRANQTYFDGMPVSYPFHLGGQSSVFNNNILSDLEILTGVYSARYGYATGGILELRSHEEVLTPKTTWNLNTFLTDIFHETPLWEGGYMLVGGRKSYPNLFLLRAYPQGIPEDAKYADFQDAQWKLGTQLGSNQKLTLIFFGARDIQGYTRTQAEFERSGRQESRPPAGLDRRFLTQGFSHEWKLSEKIRHKISVSRNIFTEYYEVRFSNPLTAENIFGLSNTTHQDLTFVENSLLLEILPGWTLDLGGNYRQRNIQLNAENITSTSSFFYDFFDSLIQNNRSFRALIDGDGIRSIEKGGFAETKIIWKNFLAIAGMRVDTHQLSGERETSPRGSLAYTFPSTKTTFQGGTGIFRNSPVGIEQISRKSGNPHLKMETSEHNVLGINQELGKNWTIKVEGFRNVFRNLVVADTWIRDPYAPNTDTRDLVERPGSIQSNPFFIRELNYSNRGYGYSEGVEVFIRKNPNSSRVSRWFGWISYSNSLTKRNNNQPRLNDEEVRDRNRRNFRKKLRYQVDAPEGYWNLYDDQTVEFLHNNDQERLYDLDRTHIVSLVFGWKINPEWQFGGRFRYATSLPVTQITGSRRLEQAASFGVNLHLPEFSEHYNGHRLPSTHQLDIRVDRFFPYSWGYINWYLELINVYGRRNPVAELFDSNNAFSRTNPSYSYDTLNSPSIQSVDARSKIVYLPMLQFGLEAKW